MATKKKKLAKKAPAPREMMPAPKRVNAVSDDIARETFASVIGAARTPEGKLIMIELARRGGVTMNLVDLSDALFLRIGEVDQALPRLERDGIIHRPRRGEVALTQEHMDLVGVLGHLVDNS